VHPVFSARLDILIHAEQVFRVVLALHLGETMVVRAVGGGHAIGLVGGKEIDVDAAAGEGGRGIEEVARLADAARVVGRVLPAPVDIQDELGIAVGVYRSVRCRTVGGAAEGAQEDLALRRRQLADVLDNGVEQSVVERR
jgi:hypothetical protein